MRKIKKMKSAMRKINLRINIFTVGDDAEVRKEPLARDILQIRKWKVAASALIQRQSP